MTQELEKILYKWFEMKYQTYDKLEHDGSIYLYYEGQEYVEIRIDKESKYIYYKWSIYWEFFEIISLGHDEFAEFMTKWVEETFNLNGLTPGIAYNGQPRRLKRPLI